MGTGNSGGVGLWDSRARSRRSGSLQYGVGAPQRCVASSWVQEGECQGEMGWVREVRIPPCPPSRVRQDFT